jgi:hypothetical protein
MSGKRCYRYREIAWLQALYLCTLGAASTDPFATNHRVRVAHSRLCSMLPSLDEKASSDMSRFWRKLGAIKVHGFDTRGTDYEIVKPDPSEMTSVLRGQIEGARVTDYLSPPRDVETSARLVVPLLRTATQRTTTKRDDDLRRGRVLESLDRKRSDVAERLEVAAGLAPGSLRYKSSGSHRAAQVEACIDYMDEKRWTWFDLQRVTQFVSRDIARPKDVSSEWLFDEKLRPYLDGVLRRLDVTIPATITRERIERDAVAALLRLPAGTSTIVDLALDWLGDRSWRDLQRVVTTALDTAACDIRLLFARDNRATLEACWERTRVSSVDLPVEIQVNA